MYRKKKRRMLLHKRNMPGDISPCKKKRRTTKIGRSIHKGDSSPIIISPEQHYTESEYVRPCTIAAAISCRPVNRQDIYMWILNHTLFRGFNTNIPLLAITYHDLIEKAPVDYANVCAWIACKFYKDRQHHQSEKPCRISENGRPIFWEDCTMFSDKILLGSTLHGDTLSVIQMTEIEKQVLARLDFRCHRETVYTYAVLNHYSPYIQQAHENHTQKTRKTKSMLDLLTCLCVALPFVKPIIEDKDIERLADVVWHRTLQLSEKMGWVYKKIPERTNNDKYSRWLDKAITSIVQNELYSPIMKQIKK